MSKPFSIFFTSLVVFALGCAGHEQRTASKSPKLSMAQSLIQQLPSQYPPAYENGYWGFEALSGRGKPDTLREKDTARVQAVLAELEAMGIDAFGDLVDADGDNRYCYWTIGAAVDNISVGDACFFIIVGEVCPKHRCQYKMREDSKGQMVTYSDYLFEIRENTGMKSWWWAHKDESLQDIQIEALRWTIDRENSIGFSDPVQRDQIIQPLELELKVLTSPAATRPQ